jgi:RIO kinase 1
MSDLISFEDDPDYEDYSIYLKQRARTGDRPRSARRAGRAATKSPDPARPGAGTHKRSQGWQAELLSELADEQQEESARGFNPTFASLAEAHNHVSNHEREWIVNYLGGFYIEHLITDVTRRVKSGKEATVYCCRAHPRLGVGVLAGKVYHERMFRSLKNDSLYRQGRDILDEQGKPLRGRRERLAMKKGTGFGQQLRQVTWLNNEYQALQRLHSVGADVPAPYAHNDNAILMEYIGDEQDPAPPLVRVTLSRSEARALFDMVMHNIELMLANDIIHADLSAHNILYWEGRLKIIDFPQAVNPLINPHALPLLVRDIERVCQYFAKYNITAHTHHPALLAAKLWSKYEKG